jgi:hypothetical protein
MASARQPPVTPLTTAVNTFELAIMSSSAGCHPARVLMVCCVHSRVTTGVKILPPGPAGKRDVA